MRSPVQPRLGPDYPGADLLRFGFPLSDPLEQLPRGMRGARSDGAAMRTVLEVLAKRCCAAGGAPEWPAMAGSALDGRMQGAAALTQRDAQVCNC
jgi:hypothetical protein